MTEQDRSFGPGTSANPIILGQTDREDFITRRHQELLGQNQDEFIYFNEGHFGQLAQLSAFKNLANSHKVFFTDSETQEPIIVGAIPVEKLFTTIRNGFLSTSQKTRADMTSFLSILQNESGSTPTFAYNTLQIVLGDDTTTIATKKSIAAKRFIAAIHNARAIHALVQKIKLDNEIKLRLGLNSDDTNNINIIETNVSTSLDLAALINNYQAMAGELGVNLETLTIEN